MIEYLYDAIRATAGEPITIAAEITDDNGECITDNCGLMLHNDNEMIIKVNGSLDGDIWSFVIPAEATKGLVGRYWYCICKDNQSLCFRQPLYLI
jgi:hypothetical protein